MVVTGDPSATIADMRKVELVFRRVMVDPAKLLPRWRDGLDCSEVSKHETRRQSFWDSVRVGFGFTSGRRKSHDTFESRSSTNPANSSVPSSCRRSRNRDAEWRAQLTPEQFEVARGKGTERPFCGTLLDNKRQGVYTCVCCGLPLFTSNAKFNSGTGWPSFFQPVADENVVNDEDRSYGMRRVEILCARCDCHLGHVFEDGPRPTGLRYLCEFRIAGLHRQC